MRKYILFGAVLMLHIGCQAPKLDSQPSSLEDDQDLSIHVCGHFQASSNTSSLDCASTPQDAYSATVARRTRECGGNSTCLNSGIYLFISTPTPPVPASYMQQYAAAARQIEAYMAPKDLGSYQRTLEELAKGASLIGKTETENLRREYETKLNQVTRDKITSLGSAAFGAERTVFLNTKYVIEFVKRLNDKYIPIVNQLTNQFKMLATQYQTLRSTETAAIDGLAAAVSEASHADTDASAAALTHVIEVARRESGQTNAFAVEASRFRVEFAARASQYSSEIAAYGNTIEELNLPVLDFWTPTSVSVESMIRYAEQRDARMADAAERLIVQIQLRLRALQAAAAAEGVRQALANAALLKASTEFLATANARIAEILRTPAKSPVLGISILSPMQRDMVAFLLLEPPCLARGATNPWMDTGCNVLAVNFSKARQFLNTRIPGTIRIDAGTFRRHNAPAEAVATMEQQLAAGNLEAACRSHDELIGVVENAGGSK